MKKVIMSLLILILLISVLTACGAKSDEAAKDWGLTYQREKKYQITILMAAFMEMEQPASHIVLMMILFWKKSKDLRSGVNFPLMIQFKHWFTVCPMGQRTLGLC